MKLPFLDKFFSKEKENEFFIALEMKQRSLVALLLEKKSSQLRMLGNHETPLTKNINHLTPEELIQGADRAISQIEGGAPPGTFIKKTIFTIPYEWQEGGKVDKEHLATLKKLCDDLELTPVGFLVPIEAIIHAMQQRDGELSNAIFLELEEQMLTAYIARAGTIVEIHRQSLAESIGHTAEALLKQIKSLEVLPGRIFVLRSTRAENVQQELVGREWTKDLPFLHPPQVSVMDREFENDAIIQGVAEQMKLHVGMQTQDDQASSGGEGDAATAADLGFHKDIDVAKEKPMEPLPLAASGDAPLSSDNIVINEGGTQEIESEADLNPDTNEKKSLLSLPSFVMPLISKVKSPFRATSGIPIGFKVLPLVAILFLAALVYAYYAFLLKADVVIYADEKRSQDELPVVLSVSDDTGDETIRIKVTEVEIEGSESTQATGEEKTGEKATGEVTVFNKTESPTSFSSGETITTDSGLSYILTEDIEIASTSAFSTSYSSKKVKVEASEFGDEYNIENNTNFTFDEHSSSDFFAKNSDKFSGGTSKELTVVSEEDVATLEKKLLEKLQKEALKKAEDDISSQETLIPRVISASLTDKSFDKKAGDEAKSVTLEATGVFEVGYYEDKEISNFIKGVSTEDVPEGYVFDEKGSSVDFEEIEVEDDGELSAQAKITSLHIPSISKDKLRDSLTRKSAVEAKEIIEENDGTKRFEIVYHRMLPFMPELLPWSAGNINVILKNESD